MHGLLNLNKPAGVTSRDIVNRVQQWVEGAKVGHAGTLDPLATGVLVIGIGNATRLIEYVQRLPKFYAATFLLGRRSNTDDMDGNVTEVVDARQPTRFEIEELLPCFIGEILQRPPDFSAVKVQGQRAYDRARRGQPLALAERPVHVHAIRVVHYEYPVLELAIECGSGVYVRSIGRDLAERLGTGAVMSQLVRTAIGSFRLDSALDPSRLDAATLASSLIPIESAVQALPVLQLTADETNRVRRGQFIERPEVLSGAVAALDTDGHLVAVLVPHGANALRPEKVIGS